MSFIVGLLATLALALTSASATAVTPVTTCGTVIIAAGDYQLAGNLGPCTGDGVVITASNVNFDLAGFSITGVSSLQSCNTSAPQSMASSQPRLRRGTASRTTRRRTNTPMSGRPTRPGRIAAVSWW